MEWQTNILPTGVEYRQTRNDRGVRVVRVFCDGPDPRIVMHVEDYRSMPPEQRPMSIFWDELEMLVKKAQELFRENWKNLQ